MKLDLFFKKKDVTITWHTNLFFNSSTIKRPNSNYDIFVEKRSCKEMKKHACLKVYATKQVSNGSSSNTHI